MTPYSSEVVLMAVQQATNSVEGHESEKAPTFMRVKVVDTAKDGRPAVNIKVPIGVVKFGMKMAQAFSAEVKGVKVDWDSIATMIAEGERGQIVEIEDETAHRLVEVWVE